MVTTQFALADYDLLRWIPLIPLLAAAFNLFWGRALGKRPAGALASLTARERQVLLAFADGAANKAVAYHLGLSVRTIEVYRANMVRKLGVRNLTQALFLARDGGYL